MRVRPHVLVPFLILSSLLFRPPAASSQEPLAGGSLVKRPLPAVRTSTSPKIDGDITDAAWAAPPKAETFVDRQSGMTNIDQTTAWVLYDDKYIYVAFHCKDSQPDQVVGRETIRDSRYSNDNGSGGEDGIEIHLDPFQSHRIDDLSLFYVNPLGTPSARPGGGRANKTEWKGEWDAAAKRTPDGWTAEMRIPWAMLNYPGGKAPQTFGINFARFQYRTRVSSAWSNIGPNRFLDLQGHWTGVVVPAGAFRRTLSLLPYVLPGMHRSEPTFRSGLDARYTLTPEMTAVGSINPDFGTIEGAVEGIQFSRSERFVEERRPFFLEGRDYLGAGEDFSIGPYFYSRRIQNFDFGTKVYGKLTPTDTLGFLNTVDISNRMDTVTQYRHTLSPTSSIAMFLAQKSARDDNNTAGFLMHNVRWGKFGIDTHLGLSGGRDAGGPAQHMNFTYEDKLFFTSLLFVNVSPSFRDAEGLVFFNDYRGVHLFQNWGAQWRKGFWRSFNVEFFPGVDWHSDGRPFRRGGGLDVIFDTRSDYRLALNFTHQKFDDQLDSTVQFRIRRGVTNRFSRVSLFMTTGRLGDRPYSFVGPEFSIRTLKKLDIAYGGAVQNLDGRTQQHVLTLNYELSPTRSFGGRVVTQDADTNWYLSYRSSGQRGTETYFILGDPNARRFSEQLRMKMVFAL